MKLFLRQNYLLVPFRFLIKYNYHRYHKDENISKTKLFACTFLFVLAKN